MIEIRVKSILGMVALIGGYKEQIIRIKANSSISDLLDKLIAMYGENLRDKLFEDAEKTRNGIAMFLNGRNIFALEGFNTKLNQGDEFLIFPPVGGG